jgi:hypothetical protein
VAGYPPPLVKEIDMNWKILANRRSPSGSETNTPIVPRTEADVLPRRNVLRGALAAGCSLLLPAALTGCDTKKETGTADTGMPPAPGPESAAPTSPAPGMESAAPAAPAKVSQASVKYQTQPKGEQKCANCMHFIAESNTCKLVEGDISPEGWCILWAKAA